MAEQKDANSFFFQTKDQISLYVKEFPNSDPNAIPILIIHGLGEHSGRYQHVAHFFNRLGFKVACLDLRGHGQSGGARGDVPHCVSMVEDIALVVQELSHRYQQKLWICAHSMGALFSTRFALQYPNSIAGLILSSPAFSVKTNWFEKVLFKISHLITPHLGVVHGTNGQYLSHDPQVVHDYQHDQRVHSRISASLFQSMLTSMRYVKAHAKQLSVPMLLLVAGNDLIVNPRGARAFVQQLEAVIQGSTLSLVTMIHYDGFYHEIFNELESQRVFDDIQTWLETKQITINTSALH